MPKYKFFGKRIEPSCSYCKYGELSTLGTHILCERAGVMPLYGNCRKFAYNPLKRIPMEKKLMIAEYAKEDFSLD